jgi:hypothetical protein
MIGTQKQIKWAESIINTAIAKGNNNLREAQERYDRLKDCTAELKILNTRQAIEKLIADKLKNIETASWVIENRNNIRWSIFVANAKELPKDIQLATVEFFPKIDDLRNWIG